MVSNDVFRSARLKIDRASEHIDNVNLMLKEKRPFRYIIETEVSSGRRSLKAECDQAVVDALSVRYGDAIHNLRSALDHAYTAVFRNLVLSDGERRSIQFPFSETAARLEKACRNRQAHKISPQFLDAMIAIKPHGEAGGNELLYFMHSLDLPDKHAHVVPVVYQVELDAVKWRELVPDFPKMFSGIISVSNNGDEDFSWYDKLLSLYEWVKAGSPETPKLKQEINIPVDILFEGRREGDAMLVVPTLHDFVKVTQNVVSIIESFA